MANLEGGQLLAQIESKWPELGLLLRTKVIPAINQTAANAAVAPVGNVAAPDPPQGVSVKITGELMHVAIDHNSQIQKGVQYFTEVATNPSFSQPIVIDHGASRTSHPFTLPTKDDNGVPHTYYVQSYAQYHGSDPSEKVAYGGASPAPISMAGTTNMTLLPSNGSGTAHNNGQQAGSGIGKVQIRPSEAPKRNVNDSTAATGAVMPPLLPDFALMISPPIIPLVAGGAPITAAVVMTPLNGFTASVTVTLTGLPANVSVLPTSLILVPGVPQNFTFTATSAASAGAATLTVTGVAALLTHTVLAEVMISPMPPPTGTATVAPAIPGRALNTMYAVKANALTAPVYTAPVQQLINPQTSVSAAVTGNSGFCSFAFTGTVPVAITYPAAVTQARVVNLAGFMPYSISGNTVTISVATPGPILVEINDDQVNSLQIFANQPFVAPTPGPRVMTLPPGQTFMNTLSLRVGATETLVIPDGSELVANDTAATHFVDTFGANLKILGTGIINNSATFNTSGHKQNAIFAYQSPGLVIDGPIIFNASSFHVFLTQTNGITINNVKVIGSQINCDAFDFANTSNVVGTQLYGRTFDDIFVGKATDATGIAPSNNRISNSMAWNCVAHAASIGNETLSNIDGWTFDGICVPRDKGRVALFGVYQGNGSAITNTKFTNPIVLELQKLIDIQVPSVATGGAITNVLVQNCATPTHQFTGPNVYGISANISALGKNGTNNVTGCTFDTCLENGVPLTLAGVSVNAFTTGTVVTP